MLPVSIILLSAIILFGNKKLKIAFVIPRADRSRGGAESWLFDFIEDILPLGHELTILCTQAKGVPEGVKARIFPVWGGQARRIMSFWRQLDKYLAQASYDIVHSLDLCPRMNVHNPHGGAEEIWLNQYLKSKKGLEKTVASFRRRWFPRQRTVFKLQAKQMRDPHLKKIIAISPFVKEGLQKVYGLPDDKFSLVPNGVDVSHFSPVSSGAKKESLRKENQINLQSHVLLFIANNFSLKGLHNVIDMVRVLKSLVDQKIQVIIAGAGKKGPFVKRIRQFGLTNEFRFLGPVPNLLSWYQLSDLYLAPTWYDACSLSTLEALACGLPVVTSRFNGASMYVQKDTGAILDDPSKARVGAQAIHDFLDPQKAQLACTVGPESLKSYTRQANTQEILKVYVDALK